MSDDIKATQMDWQPIETAPKGEEPILLFYDFRPCSGEEVYGIDLCEWNYEKELFFAVSPGSGYSCARAPIGYTHWMPLPSPPKPDGHESENELASTPGGLK